MKNKILQLIPKALKQAIKDIIFGKSIDETEIIFEILKSRSGKGNIMVDVGAHFGTSLMPFAEIGWTIFALEPDPNNRKKLEVASSNFENVSIDTRAVSDESNLEVSFFTSQVSTGISSIAAFHESHKATTKVKTITLEDFCKEKKIEKINFLKIDTEGFDLMVLKGFDWDNQEHPDYIVTEFEDRKTKPLGYSFLDQATFLEEKGYKLLISEWFPIVEYGKRHKWKGFLKDKNQVINTLAWGNIIATKPNNFTKLEKAAKKMS